MVGLILPSDDPNLLGSSGANTKASPFVLAIQLAGVSGLPSVFNAVITISVLSVANSCTFGSTRTMQALAARGMGPKFLMYIDSKGRPLWCIVIQLIFGLLAFVNEATAGSDFFTWLLSLSGLSYFFVWGSICLSHIRFRRGWMVQGHTLDELPFQAQFGVIGSYIGFFLACLSLVATFYVSLFVSRQFCCLYSSILMLTSIIARPFFSRPHRLFPRLSRGAHRHCALHLLENLLQEQGWLVRASTPDGSVDRHADVRSGPAGQRQRGEEHPCTSREESCLKVFCLHSLSVGCELLSPDGDLWHAVLVYHHILCISIYLSTQAISKSSLYCTFPTLDKLQGFKKKQGSHDKACHATSRNLNIPRPHACASFVPHPCDRLPIYRSHLFTLHYSPFYLKVNSFLQRRPNRQLVANVIRPHNGQRQERRLSRAAAGRQQLVS